MIPSALVLQPWSFSLGPSALVLFGHPESCSQMRAPCAVCPVPHPPFLRTADDPTDPSRTLRSPGLAKNVIAVGAGYKTTSDTTWDDLLVVAGAAARGRETFSFPVGNRRAAK